MKNVTNFQILAEISICLPSLTSQGKVVKLLVTFARAIPESD